MLVMTTNDNDGNNVTSLIGVASPHFTVVDTPTLHLTVWSHSMSNRCGFIQMHMVNLLNPRYIHIRRCHGQKNMIQLKMRVQDEGLCCYLVGRSHLWWPHVEIKQNRSQSQTMKPQCLKTTNKTLVLNWLAVDSYLVIFQTKNCPNLKITLHFVKLWWTFYLPFSDNLKTNWWSAYWKN